MQQYWNARTHTHLSIKQIYHISMSLIHIEFGWWEEQDIVGCTCICMCMRMYLNYIWLQNNKMLKFITGPNSWRCCYDYCVYVCMYVCIHIYFNRSHKSNNNRRESECESHTYMLKKDILFLTIQTNKRILYHFIYILLQAVKRPKWKECNGTGSSNINNKKQQRRQLLQKQHQHHTRGKHCNLSLLFWMWP